MVSYIGNYLLCFSLIFSSIQFFISYKKNYNSLKFLKLSSVISFLCTLGAFTLLIYSYLISDFSILNVYQNSHTSKPLLYKITAVWGNHEGSMLLWILILLIFNFFIFKVCNQKNYKFIYIALETQALIIIGFLIFTIFTSNPFQKIIPTPQNGLGFNPILQDPALAVHPPLLYAGYVGLSAAFSFSIATLRSNPDENIYWHIYLKPFVLSAWSFLTLGIALGSIWAYYELGWGGWWFWDPVENASLMPWLLATALLHSIIIVDKKKSLQSWVLFLSILAFLLSVVGTFLVRSGILTSVHTFALDPTRGIYILIFFAFLGFYSLIIYGMNSKKYINKNYFSFFSKEGSILINNIIMIVVCSTVFIGTIYPLIIEAFTNNKISVGEPYFNSTVIPLMIPGVLIMGIGPILSWQEESKFKIIKEIIPSLIITTIITFIFFYIYKSFNLLGFFGIILSFWIISNNLMLFSKKIKKYSTGMLVAHIGFGLLILGITASSIWQIENISKMKLNNKTKILQYNIKLENIEEVEGSNYVALKANFVVYDEKNYIVTKLKPENRFYPITNIFTTEASIHTNLLRDLYIVLGDGNINDGWVVKIYYNPLVAWIWIGALTIFVGGMISMTKNLKKFKKLNI